MDEQTHQLADAREREAATREILRVISRSPSDYAPVFQTILNHAVRLNGAPFGGLFLLRDGHLHIVANVGVRSGLLEKIQANPLALDLPHNLLCQAARAREPRQIVDLLDEVEPSQEARCDSSQDKKGTRTILGVPILQGDELLGVIGLFRKEVKAFADDEIELVRTFADQAAIAIENVHQFQAVQSRTADLTKSLERQTATSEILRSISQSPTDYAPVFQTILDNAIRLCGAPFGTLFLLRNDQLDVVADAGSEPAMVEHLRLNPMRLHETSAISIRAVIERVPKQQDLMDDDYYSGVPRRLAAVDRFGVRTWLCVPMLKGDEVVGVIGLYRKEAEPFTDDDVALVTTFADQAVIAIENVRLFQALESRNVELGESLERQTATSEILRAISRSPTDYQPVFDTILQSAARLCDAPLARLYLLRDGLLHPVADYGEGRPEFIEFMRNNPRPADRGTGPMRRALAQCSSIHVEDIRTEALYRDGEKYHIAAAELGGVRTFLIVPLVKAEDGIGVIVLYRREVRAFEDRHVELVETFADQAVIAIENVRLFQALEGRTTDLTQSLERQTATSEILRSISASPTDYAPVFDTILENATRLCGAPFGILYLLRDDHLHLVADVGARPEYVEYMLASPPALNNPNSATTRAAKEQVPRQLTDLSAAAARSGDPVLIASMELEGISTVCAVPMLKGAETVGVIALYRREIKAFEDDDIALVSTFADQAVIAIENVRLFQALESRNSALGESLERQTATSEILRTISRSPTDYQPVFETILENATRLCDAPLGQLYLIRDGGVHLVANRGSRPEFLKFSRDNVRPADRKVGLIGTALSERRPVQANNFAKATLYRDGDKFRVAAVELEGIRSAVSVPLLKGEEGIGVMILYRREVRPFEERHVSLVETFADQAVIAIENVRLFQALEGRTTELSKTLERQTATSEILRSISRSPTDYAPVFDTILENAARLCGAPFGILFLLRGDRLHAVADVGSQPEFFEYLRANPPSLNDPALLTSIAARQRTPVQLADLMDEAHRSVSPMRIATVKLGGARTMLSVPMLKGEETVGVLSLYRREVKPFAEDDIELVSTFADQAVIAIENVRLFQALEGRTAELTKTLERQTATSEILRSISRSPTDYAPVFDTILENATRLCGAPLGALFLRQGEHLRSVASIGARPAFADFLATHAVALDELTTLGQAALERRPVQLEDTLAALQADAGTSAPGRVASAKLEGIRTFLAVPMLRDDQVIGVIAIYRREVHAFDPSQIELVETFADQAVIAIENVRLFQTVESRSSELTQSVAELEALGEVAQAVSSSLDLDTVLDTIINRAVQLSRADTGAINEFDEATGTLPFRAAPGMEHMLELPAPRLGEGAVGRAAATRAPVQIADITAPGAYTGHLMDTLADLRIRSLLAVPMMQNDRVLGALVVGRRTPGEFPPEAVRLLRALGTQSAIAIRNARLFREIEDKGRELEAANRHKSEFLANMSHELRTPLNAVIGFSEVLGERMFGELNDKQAEYVTDIHDSGRHLLSLINDILDLSKIEAGAMELDLGRFALAPALDNALTLVRERAERRGVVLQAQLEEDLGEMEGDERKLKQILLNLLSNAIKFTGADGSVTLEARQDDEHVHIAVRDTGVGISEEDLAVIFEEFKQVGTDYARKVEGTGLGLTLTKRFVEMHGGHITVTSEPDAGSVFTVVLPLRQAEQTT